MIENLKLDDCRSTVSNIQVGATNSTSEIDNILGFWCDVFEDNETFRQKIMWLDGKKTYNGYDIFFSPKEIIKVGGINEDDIKNILKEPTIFWYLFDKVGRNNYSHLLEKYNTDFHTVMNFFEKNAKVEITKKEKSKTVVKDYTTNFGEMFYNFLFNKQN